MHSIRLPLGICALAFVLSGVLAQTEPEPDPGLVQLRLKLNPEYANWSPGYVLERCAEHWATMAQDLSLKLFRRNYDDCDEKEQATVDDYLKCVRWFDLSDQPRAILPAGSSSLLFWNNSMSPAQVVRRALPVPNTDNRIFWIDLNWFRWTPQVWEKVAAEDPYFREPLVPSNSAGLLLLKQKLLANPVVRASWFIYYSSDNSLFLKNGDIKADNAFYYALLYSTNVSEQKENKTVSKKVKVKYYHQDQHGNWIRDQFGNYPYYEKEEEQKVTVVETKKTFGIAPANKAEFEAFWGIDKALLVVKQFAKDRGTIDRGGVVDEGESMVSYKNRVLHRIMTPAGAYWQTYDVFRTSGDQDFLETLPVPPKKFDAQELIFQDTKGGQFYLLTNGDGGRVEFADPRVVRDLTSGGNTAVITSKGCVSCHENGIIDLKNDVTATVHLGVKLKAIDEYEKERLEAFYLQNLKRQIAFDQENYAEFIKSCNGLTAAENTQNFNRLRLWYARPLDMEQAAREVGAESVQELADALQVATKARIGRLILGGRGIPRETWEYGLYAETFLLLLEYRKSANREREQRGLPLLEWK